MKKRISIIFILLLFISITAFGQREILIDFNNLEGTDLDIVKSAGTQVFNNPQIAEQARKDLIISLDPDYWDIELAPSARTIENIKYSMCKKVLVPRGQYQGQTVLGARIHFPTLKIASWAKIKPPYEIPAYEKKDENDKIGDKYVNKGIVRNVGTIKYLRITVYGRNFPHSLTVRLKNQNDEYIDIFVGYLDFNGWKTFTVENPNYIPDARKRELKKYPLYPQETPYVKLDSFIVYKYADGPGGDFVIYIKSVELIFDLAVLKQQEDIDDEAVWHILAQRREARRRAEAARIGVLQLLRWEEKLKLAKESVDSEGNVTTEGGNQQNNNTGGGQ